MKELTCYSSLPCHMSLTVKSVISVCCSRKMGKINNLNENDAISFTFPVT